MENNPTLPLCLSRAISVKQKEPMVNKDIKRKERRKEKPVSYIHGLG